MSHPVRRISPQNWPGFHGHDKIIQVPVQRKAGNHCIKQVGVHGVFQSGPQAVGCSVQPDLADPRVHRSRQQKPDPFHATRRSSNRGRLYVTVSGQPIRVAEDVRFYRDWVERLIARAETRSRFDNPGRKAEVLALFRKALAWYQAAEAGRPR